MKEIKKAKSGTDATFGFVGPAGQLSNLLIEDLAKIDAFWKDHGAFKK